MNKKKIGEKTDSLLEAEMIKEAKMIEESLLGNAANDFEISDEVYADILKAEKGRNEELINMYCSSVEEQIQNYLSETGYQFISCDTKINLDEGSDEYGRIIMLDIALKKEDKLYMGNDSGFYDYDVVTLKNYLANFYNIPRANIYINIYDGQDNKEGIEN